MARNSLSPRISADIIAFVKSNAMRKGQHLPLQMLADTFRVSRAPVMSALRTLETQGIVHAEPNRGYFLDIDSDDIDGGSSKRVADVEDREAIYFRIAQDRLSGMLAEKVSENELMRLYGLPRSRLLKVLHRIADEGWIERLPGNGWWFLPALTSRQSYEEGYVFRAVIEQQAMLLPGFEPDPDGFARARAVQTALADGGYEHWSRAEIFEANNDFHEMLVGCSRNAFFVESIRRINRLRRLLEYRITIDRSRLPRQTAEHLQILDLIEADRRTEAAAFLYTHIMGASRIKTPQI